MRIVVISEGDPELSSTWSGVPRRLVCELRRRGHEIVPLDYKSVWWATPFRVLFNRVIKNKVKGWGWHMFNSTRFGIRLYSYWLRGKIARAGKVDLIIAMSYYFDFTKVKITAPVIMIHDFTNGYLRALFGRFEPRKEEICYDRACFDAMKSATRAVSLYAKSYEYIKEHIGEKALYICNPVNCDDVVDVEARANKALKGRHILCVGNSTYQRSVETVIKAANFLKAQSGINDIVIDVVGLYSAAAIPDGVTVNFHGYLNQSNPEQKKKYKLHFEEARCFVNVRRGWCGGSSIAEALYRGVPVIVSDIPEIRRELGSSEAVVYSKPEDEVELAQRLKMLFDNEAGYRDVCNQAHETMSRSTYARFVDDMLGSVGVDSRSRN